LRGRFFVDTDDASKPRVVIINRALARKYFPGEDALGKKLGDTRLSPKPKFSLAMRGSRLF
jgi:macrolide transport system ATP-binding/permease protein